MNDFTSRGHLTQLSKWTKLSVLFGSAFLLAACGGDDNDDDNDSMKTYSFEITLTNLAHNQPLSPIGVLVHDEEFSPWQIGEAASNALEALAEGGDNSAFIAQGAETVYVSQSGNGLVLPGANESISVTLSADDGDSLNLSLATMLVNTNDAFVGVNSISLNDLAVGSSMSSNLLTYDAGTEANSESAGTIPGPADGGEGTNTERDDVNFVAMHPGVVGQDDGLTTSVLDSTHKFDNPTAKLVVRRTQ